jgi:hypothetical protein
MRKMGEALKARFTRRTALATSFAVSGRSDRACHEPSWSPGSCAVGQLIGMTDWRLLPPVDSDHGAAA